MAASQPLAAFFRLNFAYSRNRMGLLDQLRQDRVAAPIPEVTNSESVPHFHAADSLSELKFSDLIIGPRELPNSSYIKGLEGGPKLVVIPDKFAGDLEYIRAKAESTKLQDFSMLVDTVHYRVSRMDTISGVYFTLRRGISKVPSLSELGFAEVVSTKLLETRRRGLLLFCGPMGSGKTTSASSFVISWLQKFGGHCVTIEDPPELPMQGPHGAGVCFQTSIESSSFAREMIKVLRFAAPEVIFLSELRDSATVAQALRAAVNGHLIVATVHGSGIEETLNRILVLGKENDGEAARDLLAAGLFGLIFQELEGSTKKLKVRVLFTEDDIADPVRSLIRDDKLMQLGTEVKKQQTQLLLRRSI